MKKELKSQFLTIAALVVLFFTRWVYYTVELALDVNLLFFTVETVFFVLLYVLFIFRVPQLISVIVLFAGCIGMSILYGTQDYALLTYRFQPFAYFPAFLFLFEQSNKNGSEESTVGKVLSKFQLFSPVILLVFLVYSYFTIHPHLKSDCWHFFLVYAFLTVVYYIISRPVLAEKQKTKKGKKKIATSVNFTFLTAAFIIPETCLYILFNDWSVLSHTVAVLWIINLIMLYHSQNELVVLETKRISKHITAFTQG